MRRQATDARAPRAGFTTTEVLVAVALCLITAVIAVAGFQLYQTESPVRGAATRLTHALATARTYAVANNTDYAVRLDPVHQQFWIDEVDDNGATVVPKVTNPEPLGEQVALDAVWVDNFRLLGQATLRFAPDGHGDDAVIYLRVAGRSGQDPRDVCTVKLYGPTGQAHVFAGQRLDPDTSVTLTTANRAGRR